MKDEYDFSGGKRGAVLKAPPGKTRITIRLDNDILEWSYHRMPELLGSGWGCEVRTEGELEQALIAARANKKGFSIINLHLDKMDRSDAIARMGKRLAQRLGKKRARRSAGR